MAQPRGVSLGWADEEVVGDLEIWRFEDLMFGHDHLRVHFCRESEGSLRLQSLVC